MSQNLTTKAVKGVQWTTTSTIITSVLQIGYTSVMSRLLDPTAFGLIAIAQIILNFGSYFARMGMAQALIQKEVLGKFDIRAVFTSSVFLSTFFAVIIWVLAPFCAVIFDKVNDDVVLIVRIMSFNFLIGGLSTTAVSLLTREMKFKLLAIQEVGSFVVAYLGVGIIMGILDYGVWSLVFANISQVFLVTCFSYFSTRHSIKPVFNWSYYRPFFRYGSVFSITTFIDFLGMNLPLILIGRFFGDYKLGIYRQAFMIINLPLTKLSFSIQKVIFPMYSQIQADKVKLKKAYLSSITLMAAILLPIGFGVSMAAKEITLVLLGNDFIESYPVLSILALGICFKFLSQFAGIIWDATAFLKNKFYLQSAYLLLLAIASYLFKDYGLIGFAWIVTIGEIVRNTIFILVTGRILNIKIAEHFKAYLPGLLIGCLCSLSIYFVTILLNYGTIPMLVKLFLQMITGGVVLLFLIFIKPLPMLRSLMMEYFHKIDFFNSGKGKTILNMLNWDRY